MPRGKGPVFQIRSIGKKHMGLECHRLSEYNIMLTLCISFIAIDMNLDRWLIR